MLLKAFYKNELSSNKSANLSLNWDMRNKISVSVKPGNLLSIPSRKKPKFEEKTRKWVIAQTLSAVRTSPAGAIVAGNFSFWVWFAGLWFYLFGVGPSAAAGTPSLRRGLHRFNRRLFADEEDGILSRLFGLEHQSAVGGGDQIGDGSCIVGVNGQSAADGQSALSGGAQAGEVLGGKKMAEAFENQNGSLRGLLGADGHLGGRIARLARAVLFPEDNGEFVAADAGHQVVVADAAPHQGGCLAKNLVADAVAALVVVFLE